MLTLLAIHWPSAIIGYVVGFLVCVVTVSLAMAGAEKSINNQDK